MRNLFPPLRNGLLPSNVLLKESTTHSASINLVTPLVQSLRADQRMRPGFGLSSHPLRQFQTDSKKDSPTKVSVTDALHAHLREKEFSPPRPYIRFREISEWLLREHLKKIEGPLPPAENTLSTSPSDKGEKSIREMLDEKVRELKMKFPRGGSNFEKVAEILQAHTKKSGQNIASELFNTFCAQQILKMIPGLNTFAPILNVAVKSHVDNYLRGVSMALTQMEMSERDSIIKVYKTLVEQFTEIDAGRSEATRRALKGTDKQFEYGIQFNHPDNALQTLLEDRIRLMSIPEKSKDVSDDATQAAVDAVVEKKKLTGVRQALETMAVQIADNSTSPPFEGNRTQAYIYGPAGTGKTTTIEAFAKAHNLPVIHVDLGNISNPYELENLLAQKIIESGVTNPIFIMDEAGIHLSRNHQLVEKLKDLLEPGNKKLNYYGAEVDFSKASVFMMGNYELHDQALRSKLEQITIPYLTREEKVQALDAAVAEQVALLKKKGYKQEKIDDITREFNKHREFLLTEDMGRTPGGRVVKQVVAKVFQLLRVEARKRADIPLDENSMQTFICEKFGNFVSPEDKHQPPPSFGMPPRAPMQPQPPGPFPPQTLSESNLPPPTQ